MTYPGGAPDWPDVSLKVKKRRLRRRVVKIPAGAILIRAYGHTGGYVANSFNPTRASLTDPTSGGRFDGTANDPYAYSYLATPHSEPHVAFWEVFQNEISTSGKKRTVLKTDLDTRSFAYIRVLQPLRLVRMRTLKDVSKVHTDIKTMRGDNRLKTRAWAQYIRTLVGKKIHGMIYVSAVVGDSSHGDAIVLFADKCTPGIFLAIDPPEIPMSSAAGTLMVDDALKGTGIRRMPT